MYDRTEPSLAQILVDGITPAPCDVYCDECNKPVEDDHCSVLHVRVGGARRRFITHPDCMRTLRARIPVERASAALVDVYLIGLIIVAALGVFALMGCDRPVIPIRAYDEVPNPELRNQRAPVYEDLPDEVLDACDLLEIDCIPLDEPHGVVSIALTDYFATQDIGLTLIDLPCRAGIMARLDHITIAHELGHVFGLDAHSKDSRNLMYYAPRRGGPDPVLREGQLKTVRRHAALFDACTVRY